MLLRHIVSCAELRASRHPAQYGSKPLTTEGYYSAAISCLILASVETFARHLFIFDEYFLPTVIDIDPCRSAGGTERRNGRRFATSCVLRLHWVAPIIGQVTNLEQKLGIMSLPATIYCTFTWVNCTFCKYCAPI